MNQHDILPRAFAAPGTPEYDEAAGVFNLAAPARPGAAVTVRTVDEVRAAVREAGARDLPVRVHTTGHASGARHAVDGGLLVRTRLAGGVVVDARRRIARIPAGTTWGEVVAAAAPFGLTAPHGSAAGVGVVGYLLGGGVSFYGRRTGLAANSVRAVELVTADGTLVRADAENDPELLWALRGGGGGFGVVTAVELELLPVAKVVTGAAYWSAAHAAPLLAAWRDWAADAPRRATTSLRVMNLPPVPGVPPVLAAGPVLCVDGAVAAASPDEVAEARRQAEDLLGPLRGIAPPLMDTWALTDAAGVLDAHMDPAEPVPFVGDHLLLAELGDEAAAAFLGVVGEGSGSPLAVATLRQLGGAFADADPRGGVLSRLDAPFAYMGSGPPFGPVTVADLERHCAAVRAALAPWDTGTTVPSLVEGADRPQRHLDADALAAVDRVRARVDPRGRFAGDIAPGATASG
ncbi:FAD-binding oxidoreductase [Streptomyces sp. ICN441]|uniref:Oxidoreductase n=2 Tax=Streptomyces TaxID=1883 RepID=A0A2S1T2C1_9ACTN|nr:MULTISPECIES: FAD-binding protein [Streptomyces]AWI32790.1 oxidoreductase [Streptomyces tirandamycinicus]MCY0983690.1 FAD-binding protein [Streptomyces tirandamycinicus]TFE38836.1 FAD-binding oxidoreductase [Streptomyces sp. ICN441]